MARLYLVIILIGAVIGAMLPSGPVRHGPISAAAGPRPIIAVSPREDPPPTAASAVVPALGGPWTTLDRAPNGHFFADAQVNGMTVHFLVDTGATGVALSADDAQRVGLQFSPLEFTAVGTGASGEVRGKLVTLDRVSLGGRTVEGVDGVILEGGTMSLLGQSFLGKMGTIEITGDRMVIR